MLFNFIEIVLCHGCSPVNLLHIFKIPFPKNTSGRLLPYFLYVLTYIVPQFGLIQSYSDPHFSAFGLNTDQNNSEYGHLLHSESIPFPYPQNTSENILLYFQKVVQTTSLEENCLPLDRVRIRSRIRVGRLFSSEAIGLEPSRGYENGAFV